jgi:predicted RNA-binding protein with PUA-like domain
VGDRAFFYHSNIGKEVVGVVEVSEAGFPDPSDKTGKWISVKVRPVEKLKRPVTLAEIKANPKLAQCELVRYSRLSVAEIQSDEWKTVVKMAEGPAA